MEVLQKIIAASGYCSRRNAEELIRGGAVRVNGRVATVGDRADAAKDKIVVSGQIISAAPKVYLKLNKPAGYTCTNRNFPGEKNIFDLVRTPDRLFAVGRLDKDSRGLVLLTNDGDLTQKLAHPSFEHDKIYEVTIKGAIGDQEAGEVVVKELLTGIDIGEGDGKVCARKARYLQNNLFIITLNEGKKRQIRRMFAALGLETADLKRIELAGLGLGGLKEGAWTPLSAAEIKQLRS
jgi:pseudouridine synthase